MTKRLNTAKLIRLVLAMIVPCGLVSCTRNSASNSKPGDAPAGGVAVSASPECADAVYPDLESIESGRYSPLARPLFLYVNKSALAKPEVAEFLRYYLRDGQAVVSEVNYVRVPEARLKVEQEKLDAAIGTQAVPTELKGTVAIDGSSTVYPITAGIAEKFQELTRNGVKPAVRKNGTGGGFKKFTVGEVDINGASRPISPKEIDECAAHNIEYLELNVAIDGITVVVNSGNRWCDCLTVEQLKTIWEPGSKIKKWSDLNPTWPKEEIQIYGPDTDSGTFDYFTEVICGKAKASRTDYIASAEDNVLVRGVIGDTTSLGYFGYNYFASNKKSLKAVGIVPAKKAE